MWLMMKQNVFTSLRSRCTFEDLYVEISTSTAHGSISVIAPVLRRLGSKIYRMLDLCTKTIGTCLVLLESFLGYY